MRNLLPLVAFVLLFSCDSASDCFQRSGEMTSKEIALGEFDMINIGEDIELVIRKGEHHTVVIHSGSNLIDDISAKVVGTELYIKNDNGCNMSRGYNHTKVYVTTPELTKIYSASQFSVSSEGILDYPNLVLHAALFDKTASGTFHLNVNCQVLTIEDNASAFFQISGQTIDCSVNFYDGNARFDGAHLSAENVYIFQRSTNDMVIKPSQSVSGKIYSTGNVVLKSVPPIIDVEQLYTGRVIYP